MTDGVSNHAVLLCTCTLSARLVPFLFLCTTVFVFLHRSSVNSYLICQHPLHAGVGSNNNSLRYNAGQSKLLASIEY